MRRPTSPISARHAASAGSRSTRSAKPSRSASPPTSSIASAMRCDESVCPYQRGRGCRRFQSLLRWTSCSTLEVYLCELRALDCARRPAWVPAVALRGFLPFADCPLLVKCIVPYLQPARPCAVLHRPLSLSRACRLCCTTQVHVEHGAYPSPLNYYKFPRSVCTSVNEVICHGIPDTRELQDGDIVNIDGVRVRQRERGCAVTDVCAPAPKAPSSDWCRAADWHRILRVAPYTSFAATGS